jgi:hypothetical protein
MSTLNPVPDKLERIEQLANPFSVPPINLFLLPLDLRQPSGDDAETMNKWILAAILATLAVFMYVSVIVKAS